MDETAAAIERQSLQLGKWGNLLMAGAGVAAAYLSHSDALLVDGLYSGLNFVSAIVAANVAASVAKPADRRYPFGYGAYEALLQDRPFTLLEVAVTKLGRTHFAVSYVKPDSPVSGEEADALREEIESACGEVLEDMKAELIIAAEGPYPQ